MLRYIEYGIGSLLHSVKGHDDKLFTKTPAFKDLPPTITIESPDVGPSNSHLQHIHSHFGEDRFPELSWSLPSTSPQVAEYILIIEDPDAPVPFVPCHALFHGIPASTTHLGPDDIKLVEGTKVDLKGGFKLGKNVKGTVYGGPRPPLGHGPHRYFYQLVGLKEPLDKTNLSEKPTKTELAHAIVGKVAAWGQWVGVFETKWK